MDILIGIVVGVIIYNITHRIEEWRYKKRDIRDIRAMFLVLRDDVDYYMDILYRNRHDDDLPRFIIMDAIGEEIIQYRNNRYLLFRLPDDERKTIRDFFLKVDEIVKGIDYYTHDAYKARKEDNERLFGQSKDAIEKEFREWRNFLKRG